MALMLALTLTVELAGETQPNPLNEPCPPSSCGSNCTNVPFVPTNCKTTPCGPARANIIIGAPLTSPNMLWCPGGRPYALCFFSGPPEATGKPNSGNKPLSCVLDPKSGIADCACKVFNQGYYYVDINSILNRNAHYEAIDECGPMGKGCKNMEACNTDGVTTKPGSPYPCPSKTATVCSYINNQGAGSPSTWFYPEAGTADLVSTFSFAMSPLDNSGSYTLGSTPCQGEYAGCMTAPCKYSSADRSIAQCACPTWVGPYEVGQQIPTSECQLKYPGLSYVWSAAHSVTSTSACPSLPTSGKK
jgi:hypothetical protein